MSHFVGWRHGKLIFYDIRRRSRNFVVYRYFLPVYRLQADTSRRSGEDAQVVGGDIQSGFEKLIAGTVGFAVWSRKWLQLNICVPGC